MEIEHRLAELGLNLPPEPQPPPGVTVPFQWVRVFGQHAYVSGHGPQRADGTFVPPGKVGGEVSLDQAYNSARLATLAMLGSLQRSLGSLEYIDSWLCINGYIAVTPGFNRTTQVINGCSDVLIEVFGAERGAHARTAIGVAELPLGLPVVISAEVALTK
ncbi:MAG: RidA family protein [Rhizobiaceae bacterium]|nr:RidA family protein [Rhizobiaceae bacterium]